MVEELDGLRKGTLAFGGAQLPAPLVAAPVGVLTLPPELSASPLADDATAATDGAGLGPRGVGTLAAAA